jgi:argininosuccinate lyase
MDSVGARDGALEFLAAGAIAMVHLSRLAEELVLWSTSEFGFIEFSDAHRTGSSLMPQKRNPDVPELVRGKAGRAIGNLMSLLTVVKGLPLTYNRDLQEDKEPVIDSATTLRDSLAVVTRVLRDLQVNEERMRLAADDPLLLATDLAETLVRAGVPFREAHDAVGRVVAHCRQKTLDLRALTREDLRAFHPGFPSGARELLDLERSLEARSLAGGTARARVAEALERSAREIAAEREALERESAAERETRG